MPGARNCDKTPMCYCNCNDCKKAGPSLDYHCGEHRYGCHRDCKIA